MSKLFMEQQMVMDFTSLYIYVLVAPSQTLQWSKFSFGGHIEQLCCHH